MTPTDEITYQEYCRSIQNGIRIKWKTTVAGDIGKGKLVEAEVVHMTCPTFYIKIKDKETNRISEIWIEQIKQIFIDGKWVSQPK